MCGYVKKKIKEYSFTCTQDSSVKTAFYTSMLLGYPRIVDDNERRKLCFQKVFVTER